MAAFYSRDLSPANIVASLAVKSKAKVLICTSRSFQPKAGLPSGGGVKKHFTWEATAGIENLKRSMEGIQHLLNILVWKYSRL